jgi:hypothetical protein
LRQLYGRCRSLIEYGWTRRSSRRHQISLQLKAQLKAQYKDTAQYQDIKTGRTALDIRRTPNLRKILDIYKVLNLRKALDIRKVLLPLDGRSRTYEVSKARGDKAYRPVLDVEEVTVSPSTNAKGSRILFSKDLYIYLVEEG